MIDESAYMKAARRAVYEAGVVCRTVQRGSEDVKAILKDDRSPVTVADYASQAVVVHRLREELGEARVVGEENATELRAGDPAVLERVLEAARVVWAEATGDDVLDAIDGGGHEGGSGDFWTLDPIDGTKGFLRGGQYAVSLAWIESGRPALGVMGCPNLPMSFAAVFDEPDPHGALYAAGRNLGLYEAPADQPDARLVNVPTLNHAEDDAVRVCESVESGHSKHEHTVKILESIGREHRSLRLDSQAKYAVVARGQADAYLRMPTKPGYREKIWDHAAGALCAIEAGCAVTDITGSPLDFSKGARLEENRGVVCATPAFHSTIIKAIDELGYADMG